MKDPQKGNRPMDNPLSILLIEDNPDDRVLIKRGLNKGFNNLHIEEVLNQEDLDEIIAKGDFNVAITDYNLGWTDGVTVLTAIKEKKPDCPVVMMTVMDTEEIAIDAMEAGLDDYVVKSPSQFARLPDIVTTVLKHKERGKALKEAEVRYKDLYDSVPVGLFRTKLDGQIVSVNQALVDMLHYPDRESLIATNANELYVDPNERSVNMEEIKECGILRRREHKLFRYDNKEITVEISIFAIRNASGEVDVLDGYLEDISERKRVEEALSQTEVLNETIIESVQEGVVVYDRDLRYVVWNNFME
jgi:PAS domain S-box-containing protein